MNRQSQLDPIEIDGDTPIDSKNIFLARGKIIKAEKLNDKQRGETTMKNKKSLHKPFDKIVRNTNWV